MSTAIFPQHSMSTTIHVDNIVQEGSRLIVPTGLDLISASTALLNLHKAQNSGHTPGYDILGIPQVILAEVIQACKDLSGTFMPAPRTNTLRIRSGPGRGDYHEGFFGKFTLPIFSKSPEVPDPHIVTTLIDTTDATKIGVHFGGHLCNKDRKLVKALIDKIQERVDASNLYVGKAIKWDLSPFRFTKGPLSTGYDFEAHQPVFVNTDIDPTRYHFRKDIAHAIALKLWHPIRHSQTCIEDGVPLKSGVLLHGPYGCGKTILALLTAHECVKAGWTFLQLPSVDDYVTALKLARFFLPDPTAARGLVIFCEDLDQAMGTQERTEEVNNILNHIDGMDYKHLPILSVFTTNHEARLSKAMLRPGRISRSVGLERPDGETAFRILKDILSGLIPHDFKATPEVFNFLDGLIPAAIAEVAQYAKMSMRARGDSAVSSDDIEASVDAVRNHLKLLNAPVPVDPLHPTEMVKSLGHSIGSAIGAANNPALKALNAIMEPLASLKSLPEIPSGEGANLEVPTPFDPIPVT